METKLAILVVEDDPYFRKNLVSQLEPHGRVFAASGQEQALHWVKSRHLDVAFIDLNLSSTDILEGLKIISACKKQGVLPVVLTGHESKEIIGQAYQMGCSHYFSKIDFEDNIDDRIGSLLKTIKGNDLDKFFQEEFITSDPKLISRIKFVLEQPLDIDQKILITGPSGVGKTKVAKMLHAQLMPEAPFIHLNLSELSANLLESELFGHKKGAFTGASEDKIGLIERADGGILFLDEIGCIPLTIQKKLLKVIEEKSFSPVGSTEIRTSSFQLISATCDDFAKLINNEEFRVDLYFRIKGLEINIPALKQRRGDVLPLIDFFISKSTKKIALNSEAEAALRLYDWFGNVRELENLVRELVGFSKGMVTINELPDYVIANENPTARELAVSDKYITKKMREHIKEQGLPALLNEIEKEAMDEALIECNGKINEVGRKLQISKSLLYRISKDLKADTQFGAEYVQ
ncbi:MAG: sigma-54-dependent Fis family transcriptional regulator [Halobacteriovoraceae bacterium]|jgi:two-component system, NtrC family, response regulator AtoC|nr:sigma-54-dependent Fis family transcriptional regulator [Halobacteriovoraceae bacterium]